MSLNDRSPKGVLCTRTEIETLHEEWWKVSKELSPSHVGDGMAEGRSVETSGMRLCTVYWLSVSPHSDGSDVYTVQFVWRTKKRLGWSVPQEEEKI